MSDSERLLWAEIRGARLGFVSRRQHPIGPYVLDFFVFEAMLCVEVDGEQHGLRADRDLQRDRFLADRGIETLRIPSLEVFGDVEVALAKIYWACVRRTGRNPLKVLGPSPRLTDSPTLSRTRGRV